MTEQLALSLPAQTDYSEAAFIDGAANAEARAALARWRDWPDRRLALTGPAGSGKSHLAAIWARRAGACVRPASGLGDQAPDLADGRPLLIEDVDPIEDRGVDEDAIFHLLNRAAEGAIPALLLTGRRAPVHWQARLPDLVSRFRAMPHVDLHEPDDALLRHVLEKLFADRQIPVGQGVIDYVLPRMERSIEAARALVAALDHRALAKQRPVTRALAREVLEGGWSEGDSQ